MTGTPTFQLPIRIVSGSDATNSSISNFFGSFKGFFVDVGAGDPIYGNSTYFLELSGWSGLLIEPSPKLAQKLRTVRKADVIEYACVSPKRADRLPFCSFNIRSYQAFRDCGRINDKTRPRLTIRTTTLNSCLFLNNIDKIDFICISANGWEAEILSGFSASRFQPSLIMVDVAHNYNSISRLLTAYRYRPVRITGSKAWFVHLQHLQSTSITDRVRLEWHCRVRQPIYGVSKRLFYRNARL